MILFIQINVLYKFIFLALQAHKQYINMRTAEEAQRSKNICSATRATAFYRNFKDIDNGRE